MTEEEIIYDIWNVVRGGLINQDDSINERLLRSFLRKHRGKHLATNFLNGKTLPDEVFQYFGEVDFTVTGNEFISPVLPATILFENNAGIKADILGHPISLVESEEYRNSSRDRFNKNHPLLRYVNNRLMLKNGLVQTNQLNVVGLSSLNDAVNLISQSVALGKVSVSLQLVLHNPDDEPGYNWTKSQYPFPNSIVEDLINSVNAREFNLFLRMKSDETGDMRDDAKPNQKEQEL